MTDIQRWREEAGGYTHMVENKDGGYVTYADHVEAVKALEADRDFWKAALDTLNEKHIEALRQAREDERREWGFQGEGEDYMCPNCLTPWKCNGPHLDDPDPAAIYKQGKRDMLARCVAAVEAIPCGKVMTDGIYSAFALSHEGVLAALRALDPDTAAREHLADLDIDRMREER